MTCSLYQRNFWDSCIKLLVCPWCHLQLSVLFAVLRLIDAQVQPVIAETPDVSTLMYFACFYFTISTVHTAFLTLQRSLSTLTYL